MKNISIPFSFTLFNGESILCSDIFNASLTEADVKAVASAMMQRNGGHPVELVDAGTITDKIVDQIIGDVLVERFPDLESYDAVYVELQEDMPAELVAAADKFISSKSADVKYYATVDGKAYYGVAPLGLKPEVFNAMVKAASKGHDGLSDFDFLKQESPEAYELILDWTKEWAFKENMTGHGVMVDAEIREFPYQVYEQVTL